MLFQITALLGAATPGPHHLSRILDGGKKADRFLELLETASLFTPDL